ncbi:hypothetical protein CXF85_04950 [Colwellia sp. 75C3]|uniref:SHOCT domain-containing protein n=1 Tax=Colwellia sp. 75C3 TaxID=888425 RepID=UPI000C32AAF1|nr:SHOCT domain-containing protein [Colwellia sp. 75C3]PKG84961.1 hypothetical protein CXF85_04950 [Colwellia sp. 75C3]
MLTVNNTLFFIFFLCLLITSSISRASNENQYLLQKIAQAPQSNTEKNQWLLLMEQPGNSQYYYLVNKGGKVYQLQQDSPDNTSLLVDLQNSSVKNSVLQLSAFTLHPNFSLRDQTGFSTFYTAHIEKTTDNNKAKRLAGSSVSMPLAFDAVVTEWQLDLAKKVDKSKQREVLRIAIPTLKNGISQLSFNPYSKSWHEDFSQLYISLSQSPTLKKHPLYSGAILRIHPQQNSTESYTVPHSNPYYANDKIDKTLYLFGAGQIKQFIWPDKHATRLLISHQYSFNDTVSHKLSYSEGGEDWRNQAPKAFLYQNENALSANSLLVYRGQNAPALRNKLLLLSKNEQYWQLNSLSGDITSESTDNSKQQRVLPPPTVEWQLQQQALQTTHLSLYRDNRDELLFFNEDSGAIYQLFQQDIIQGSPKSESSGLGGITVFFVIMFASFGFYIFYQVNIQQQSAKSLVRREFSNLACTDDKLALNLFRRHQHEAAKVIVLTDIKQCQILLGDLVIGTINTTLGHGFNEQQEQALREIFHTEQIAKMVDGKVRRMSLSINVQENDKYMICLYLRKGSDRITKRSYFEVVDDIIDWCWFIANEINAEQTGKRILKPILTAADIALAEHKIHDDTPLHTQAANIRPATHPNSISDAVEAEQMAEVTNSEETNDGQTLSNHQNTTVIESAKRETDLVNTLEKLVKLQQQGFLTADEFEQAKAKLFK